MSEKTFKNAFFALIDNIVTEHGNNAKLKCDPEAYLKVVVIEYDPTIRGEFEDAKDAFRSRHVKLDYIPEEFIGQKRDSTRYDHGVIELHCKDLIGGYYFNIFTGIIDYMPSKELYSPITGKGRDLEGIRKILDSKEEELEEGIFRIEDDDVIRRIKEHAHEMVKKYKSLQQSFKEQLQDL